MMSRTYIQTLKFPKGTKKRNNSSDSGPENTAVPSRARRIIGLDPGLASTGWGLVEFQSNRIIHIAHGCIETAARTERSQRLFSIYTEIRTILELYKPEQASIETLYFAKNVSSALPVAEARGVVSMALAEQAVVVREFTPMAIKMAVAGSGAADKAQVQEMVRLILGLDSIPKPDHAADALAAALCCAHTVLP